MIIFFFFGGEFAYGLMKYGMFEMGSLCEAVGGHCVMLRFHRFSKLVLLRNSEVNMIEKLNVFLTIPIFASSDFVGFRRKCEAENMNYGGDFRGPD